MCKIKETGEVGPFSLCVNLLKQKYMTKVLVTGEEEQTDDSPAQDQCEGKSCKEKKEDTYEEMSFGVLLGLVPLLVFTFFFQVGLF